MVTWTFPSSSGSGSYVTTLNDDDHLSCQCRGWAVKKPGKVRMCKHTTTVIGLLGVQTEERGDFLFVLPASVASGHRRSTWLVSAATSQVSGSPSVPASPPIAKGDEPLAWAWRSPMLALAVERGLSMDAFATGQYIAEEKFDGHRAIVAVHAKEVAAWSRPQAGERRGKVKLLPPHLSEAMQWFPDGIYDGELFVPGGTSSDVGAAETQGIHRLVLFDVLRFGQQELDHTQLADRRSILEAAYAVFVDHFPVLKGTKAAKRTDEARQRVWLSPQFAPSQRALEEIWARGGEGLVLKRLDGQYEQGGRTGSWLKKPKVVQATFVLTGFEPGKNSPCGILCLCDDAGVKTTVKARNNADIRRFEANPNAFIGRGVVIECKQRFEKTGVPRQPIFDRFVDE